MRKYIRPAAIWIVAELAGLGAPSTAQDVVSSPPIRSESEIREDCIEAHQILSEGRFAEAELLASGGFNAASQLTPPKPSLASYCIDTLARVYYFGGKYADAAEVFEDVLAQRLERLGPQNARTIETAHNLAVTYTFAGRLDDARRIYDDLIRQYQAGIVESEEPSILFHQSAINYMDAGEFDLSRGHLEISMDLARRSGSEGMESLLRAMGTLSVLTMREGKLAESYKLARYVYASFRDRYGDTHPDTLTSLSTVVAISVQLSAGDVPALIDRLTGSHRRRAMVEQQLSSGGEQRRIVVSGAELSYGIALSYAALDQTDQSEAATLAANAVLRLKGLGGEYDSVLRRAASELGRSGSEMAGRLQQLWPMLEQFELNSDPSGAKLVLDEIGRTELQLARLSSNFADVLAVPSWEEVSARLTQGTVLIEYMVYFPRNFETGEIVEEAYIAAVLLRNGSEPVFADLGELDQSIRESIRLLGSLEDEGIEGGEIRGASGSLYQRLVLPFDVIVMEVDEVFISPDGVLGRIPFGLLQTPRGNSWMQENSVRMLPTGRVIQMTETGSNDGRFVAIGAADYGEPFMAERDTMVSSFLPAALDSLGGDEGYRNGIWNELDGAEREIEEVTSLFSSSRLFEDKTSAPLIGVDASEAAMRSLSGPPAILHLATHGRSTDVQFAGSSLSRVLLAFANSNRAGLQDGGLTDNDGLMRGTDIAQLNLRGTQLVALSACNTADGAVVLGEGVIGLAHAFRLAGVENVLMTYWKVDDDVTVQFMIEFYSEFLSDLANDPEVRPYAALRRTQQRWIDDLEHPRYWAAFAIVEN